MRSQTGMSREDVVERLLDAAKRVTMWPTIEAARMSRAIENYEGLVFEGMRNRSKLSKPQQRADNTSGGRAQDAPMNTEV